MRLISSKTCHDKKHLNVPYDIFCIMKKNIKIHNDTYVMIQAVKNDDKSVDITLNRILDAVEESLNDSTKELYGFSNIVLSEETLKRIKLLGFSDKEPYDSILKRALSLYNSIDQDNIVEDE